MLKIHSFFHLKVNVLDSGLQELIFLGHTFVACMTCFKVSQVSVCVCTHAPGHRLQAALFIRLPTK